MLNRLIIICGLLMPQLYAHEDPHDVIHELTHQIKKGENLEDLYMKRALEHRSLGHLKSAKNDLLKVTKLNPKQFYAWLKLAEIEQDVAAALEYIKQADLVVTSPENKALVNISYAEHYYKLGSEKAEMLALKHCNVALSHREDKFNDTELVLFKAHILHCLGQFKERASFLTEASKKNGSIVIRNKQIDGLIDSGSIDEVTPIIKAEIESSRFTSSWKIRLAKCMIASDQDLTKILNEAIVEINQRFNPAKPDTTLLLDRAVANALLGKLDEAKKDLKSAELTSHDQLLIREIRDSLIRGK